MKVELLAACSSSAAIEKARRRIYETVSGFFPGTEDFSECSGGTKELLSSLSRAFSRADVIVVGASPLTYLEQKKLLMRALNLTPEHSRAVLSAAAAALSHYTLDDDEATAHAAMPEGATLFLSDIGLFSGFAVKRGRQYLIYLPLDLDRAESIIDGSFSSYLGGLVDRERRRRERKAALAAAPEQTSGGQAEDKKLARGVTSKKAEAAREFLSASGLHVAVAKTQTSGVLSRVVSDTFGLSEYISVVGEDEHKEAASFNTHAAVYARRAMLDADAEIGAMISNVFSSSKDNGSIFVFVTVADADIARVKRVYAEPNENPKNLVGAAVDILLDLICDYEQERDEIPGGSPFSVADVDIETTRSINKKSNWLKVGICVAAALLLCVGIALLAVKIRARGGIPERETVTVFTPAIDAQAIALALDKLGAASPWGGEYADISAVIRSVTGSDLSPTGSLEGVPPQQRRRLVTALASHGILAFVDGDTLYCSIDGGIPVRYSPPGTSAPPRESGTAGTASTSTSAPPPTAGSTTAAPTTAAPTASEPTATVPETSTKAPTTAKKAETTTAKRETVTKERTTERITDPTTANNQATSGVFTFTMFGYGHGVGMSQDGAVELARAGKSYMQILHHYFGSSLVHKKDDNAAAQTVKYEGKLYTMKAYLAKSTYKEMGIPSLANTDRAKMLEAYKAQILAIYSNAKRDNFYMDSGNHALADGYNYAGTLIEQAVDAVMGEYLDYGGKPAFLPYFCRSAGTTCSVATVWGGLEQYPYLTGGSSSPETNEVKSTYTITAEDLRKRVAEYNKGVGAQEKIVLSGDPGEWIEILAHDSAVDSDTGYVSKVRVGNQTIKGITFRSKLINERAFRSHCFTLTYTD